MGFKLFVIKYFFIVLFFIVSTISASNKSSDCKSTFIKILSPEVKTSYPQYRGEILEIVKKHFDSKITKHSNNSLIEQLGILNSLGEIKVLGDEEFSKLYGIKTLAAASSDEKIVVRKSMLHRASLAEAIAHEYNHIVQNNRNLFYKVFQLLIPLPNHFLNEMSSQGVGYEILKEILEKQPEENSYIRILIEESKISKKYHEGLIDIIDNIELQNNKLFIDSKKINKKYKDSKFVNELLNELEEKLFISLDSYFSVKFHTKTNTVIKRTFTRDYVKDYLKILSKNNYAKLEICIKLIPLIYSIYLIHEVLTIEVVPL